VNKVSNPASRRGPHSAQPMLGYAGGLCCWVLHWGEGIARCLAEPSTRLSDERGGTGVPHRSACACTARMGPSGMGSRRRAAACPASTGSGIQSAPRCSISSTSRGPPLNRAPLVSIARETPVHPCSNRSARGALWKQLSEACWLSCNRYSPRPVPERQAPPLAPPGPPETAPLPRPETTHDSGGLGPNAPDGAQEEGGAGGLKSPTRSDHPCHQDDH
jgi:hypothetical protein